ncbi:MAG: peptidylprolyl isomerase [Planctomycetota bacterium]
MFKCVPSHFSAIACLSASILIFGLGCKSLQTDVYQEGLTTADGEPAYITVQHCLISFEGIPNVSSLRTREEAEALANDLFEKAKAGEDFDKIVKKHTDDSAPGIYRMANYGQKSDMNSIVPSKQIHPRNGMVPAFGNTGFPLEVGEYGLAEHDPRNSPYGWHIVKRLK